MLRAWDEAEADRGIWDGDGEAQARALLEPRPEVNFARFVSSREGPFDVNVHLDASDDD